MDGGNVVKALALALFGVLAAGCVESTFPEGLACEGAEQKCPPGQSCFAHDGAMACFSSQPDDTDAAVAIDAPAVIIDAAPGTADAAGPCDLINQTGCGAGQSCYYAPAAAGGPFCATTGTTGTGMMMTCTAMTDCVRGTGCFGMPGMMGCREYCTAATENTVCRPLDDCELIDGPIGFCQFAGCDPVLQNCAPSEACYYDSTPMLSVCMGMIGTAGTQGATCTAFNSCNKGFHCQVCAGDNQCATYCNTTNGNADCVGLPGDPACVGLPGAGTVGVCNACP